jgi:3-hydroxyisobutyrate dehydrogenase
MAERLVAGGLPTTVYDVREEAARELVAQGAKAAASPRELAAAGDVIGVCVRDDADVRAVVYGADGLLAGAGPGSVIALHSTILPSTVKEVGAAAGERGVGVVDACVSGGEAGARQGTLTYMVGGAESDLEKCRPAFETSGKRIVHTGPLGSGAAVKLCNNLMTYLAWLSAFEAHLLARASGVAQDAFEEVTRSTGNLTEAMLAFLTIHKLPDETRRGEAFQARLGRFAALAEKDLAVTLAFARENGVALPGTGLAQQLMARVYGLEDPKRR